MWYVKRNNRAELVVAYASSTPDGTLYSASTHAEALEFIERHHERARQRRSALFAILAVVVFVGGLTAANILGVL